MSERLVIRPRARALVVLGALAVASLVACGLSATATGGADPDGADALAPTSTSGADGGMQQSEDCDGGTTCDGGCTDLETDPQNCNGCGTACPSGDTCDNGTCEVLCINDTQRCSGACVDLETDPMHCGGCTNACSGTDVCSLGQCGPRCAGADTTCTPATGPKYCADLANDPKNCITCGVACASTEVCTSKGCTALCATGVPVGDTFGPASAPSMVGCVGAVLWKDRAKLCAGGMTPCTPEQWVARYGGAAPKYNYWTDAILGYYGYGNGNCTAIENGGYSCASGGFGSPRQENPMRVCASNQDGAGNKCYWDQCSLNNGKTQQYFGGCANGATASTLCCSP